MASVRQLLSGLFGATEQPVPDPMHSAGTTTFAEESNDFALAMYAQLRQRPGNLFFSPFSVRTALAMILAGARGETARQMREALRIASSDEAAHADLGRTVQRLNAAASGKHEMVVANSLWSQDGVPLLPEYLGLIAQHYEGGTNLVDFRSAPETARVLINQWVEGKTRQKIRDLIPSDSIDALTSLVLVNAVYFRGVWALPFRREATREAAFHLEGRGTVRTPLMYQQDEIRFMQGEGYQAVELAYRGGDASLLVLLPDGKNELPDLERKLSPRLLHDCTARLRVREVKLFLPQFKITWGTFDVRDTLAALGMPLAFNRFQADFSGINGHQPPSKDALFVSAVHHKAFVEVNEEGTEAAAATAAIMVAVGAMIGSVPPPVPVFRADHPFLFAIRDRESGAIVFLGRVTNPQSEDCRN